MVSNDLSLRTQLYLCLLLETRAKHLYALTGYNNPYNISSLLTWNNRIECFFTEAERYIEWTCQQSDFSHWQCKGRLGRRAKCRYQVGVVSHSVWRGTQPSSKSGFIVTISTWLTRHFHILCFFSQPQEFQKLLTLTSTLLYRLSHLEKVRILFWAVFGWYLLHNCHMALLFQVT